MRIEPGNSNIPPIPGRKSGRVVSRPSSSTTPAEESAESSGSNEIVPYLSAMDEFPEVRMELVEEVRQRLSRGEHLTRAAAERTAEAILADLASFIGH